MEPDVLELELTPQHPTLDEERFAGQVRDLIDALREDVGGVTTRTMPVPGKRGGAAQILIAVGPAAITGAVAAFKAWLDRDKLRQIAVKIPTQGEAREVEITADAANVDELEKLLVAARAK